MVNSRITTLITASVRRICRAPIHHPHPKCNNNHSNLSNSAIKETQMRDLFINNKLFSNNLRWSREATTNSRKNSCISLSTNSSTRRYTSQSIGTPYSSGQTKNFERVANYHCRQASHIIHRRNRSRVTYLKAEKATYFRQIVRTVRFSSITTQSKSPPIIFINCLKILITQLIKLDWFNQNYAKA